MSVSVLLQQMIIIVFNDIIIVMCRINNIGNHLFGWNLIGINELQIQIVSYKEQIIINVSVRTWTVWYVVKTNVVTIILSNRAVIVFVGNINFICSFVYCNHNVIKVQISLQ